MPPKRRAPARGAAKKAADTAGNRDILIIEVIEGPATGTKFTPTADVLQVGRTRSSQIYIKGDPAVSQKHASITWNGKQWRIVDLGSSNGTTVNDVELEEDGEPMALSDGDVVMVGTDTTVKVTIEKPAVKEAEPAVKEAAKEENEVKAVPKKRGRPAKKKVAEPEAVAEDPEPPSKKPAARGGRGRKKVEPEPEPEVAKEPEPVDESTPEPEPMAEPGPEPAVEEEDNDDDKENIGITVEQFIAEKVEGFIASAHDVATQEVKGLMEMKEEVKENIRKHFAEVEA